MGSKNFRYFLIVAVVLVWGVIIVRILKSVSSVTKTTSRAHIYKKSYNNVAVDTFSLISDYPDPFIPDTSDINNASLSLQNSSSKPIVPVRPDISFIEYTGMISSSRHKSKIALVTVHGKEDVIKEGGIIEGFHLQKIEKTSLHFIKQGINFIVKKNS